MKGLKRKGEIDRKLSRKKRQFKAARLIVRNLPFRSTENNVKEHFSQFGNVAEVKLLRKGHKLVGCGFVQFESKVNAAVAIKKASGKPFLGRTIIADWAIPKDQFVKHNNTNVEIKEEIKEEDDSSVKDEDTKLEESVIIKDEVESIAESDELDEDDEKDSNSPSDTDSDDGSRKSVDSDDSEDSDDDDERESSDDEDDDMEDEEEDDDDDDDSKDIKSDKIKRVKSNDVVEGRTVFIKNVPFMATEDELEEAVKKFGPICYAKICMDPMTEHSKGTAFVKFNSKQSADCCLSAGTDFTLKGAILDPHPALSKSELNKKNSQPKKTTDMRNLYLLKEGVVMAGSAAAEGVSAGDMAKRLQIEKWKRQIMRDLGKFVSRNRIVIHNLPPYYDDKRVSALLKKYSPTNSRFREVRVMRDLKNVDESGMGISKGFAFVSFDRHEDALATLRTINNNPSVFKPQKRPIVSFSIESRMALKVKELRLEKSKQPKTVKEITPIIKCEEEDSKRRKGKGKKKLQHKDADSKNVTVNDGDEKTAYSGSFATPGSKKFLNNFSTKRQALLHRKQLRKEKSASKVKNKKIPRHKRKAMKMENMTRPKNPNKGDKDFTSLVDKYKAQLSDNLKRKKWFE